MDNITGSPAAYGQFRVPHRLFLSSGDLTTVQPALGQRHPFEPGSAATGAGEHLGRRHLRRIPLGDHLQQFVEFGQRTHVRQLQP